MTDLRAQLIKLGSTEPKLRPHIRPILAALEVKTAKAEDHMPTVGVTSKGDPVQVPDKALARKLEKAYKQVKAIEADLGKEIEIKYSPRGIAPGDHEFWSALSTLNTRINHLNAAFHRSLAELNKIL